MKILKIGGMIFVAWNVMISLLWLTNAPDLSLSLVDTAVAAPNRIKCLIVGDGLLPGGKRCKRFTLSVNFAGNGAANTVARSDHTHDHKYVAKSGDIMQGDLTTIARFLAGAPSVPDCNDAGDICAEDTLVGEYQVIALNPGNAACDSAGDVCAGDDLTADDNLNVIHDAVIGRDVLATTGIVRTRRVIAGEVATPACDGTGDLCAADDVIAQSQVQSVFDVFAGRDVKASNMVKAGSPSNSNCFGAGDICADGDVVADGNVMQERGSNGTIKAAVTAQCSSAASAITRSFNNVNGAAITIDNGAVAGACTIHFGFRVDDRYMVATATGSADARGVTVTGTGGNDASFLRWTDTGAGLNGPMYVLVY